MSGAANLQELEKIAFIGLGKLGLPIAEAISEKYQVVGYDIEPRVSKNIEIKTSLAAAVTGVSLVFVAVPTPHAPEYDGSQPVRDLPIKDFDYSAIIDVLSQIGSLIEDHQTVALISTVLPGTIRAKIAPLFSTDNLIYNPFLIAMGTEVADFFHPEMVILGSKCGRSTNPHTRKIRGFYSTLVHKETRYVSGTWEEAESTKIFYNTFISFKLSLVNMIQDVAMALGHMSVDTVAGALADSTHRIISPAYMKAGLGDGGPCHPRDNIALRYLSENLQLGYDLFGAIADSREVQAENMAKFLGTLGSSFIVLGKNYKPNTHLTDGSYISLVSHFLKKQKKNVWFFDPKISLDERPIDPILTDLHEAGQLTYIINYWEPWVQEFDFIKGAKIFDPWRSEIVIPDVKMIRYGETRNAVG